MATPNETLLCGWLAAGDRGEVEQFGRYLHPDVVVHAPRGLSTTGIEQEKAVWVDARRAIPDLRHDVQETLGSESRAVARVVVTGTLHGEFAGVTGSDTSFRLDQIVFAHVEDGLIVEVWEVADIGVVD